MLIKNFLKKISLLHWFFQICHSGKYYFLTGSFIECSNFKQIPSDKLFAKMSLLLRGLDTESCETCLNYFLFFYHVLPASIKVIQTNALYQQKQTSCYEQNLRYLQSKYSGFKDELTYEMIGSHHGLLDLPEKAKKYIQNKIFIDAGAYNGNSSLIFLEYLPKKVYAFDISEKNSQKFQKNMQMNKISTDKVELFRNGLGDAEQNIAFEDGKAGSTSLNQSGTSLAHITTVDSFFRNIEPIGFIKADVEGFGYKMLRGMTEILKRDRPVLSLSIYHNAEEFLEMKPYLESLDLNYNIQIIPMANAYFGEISLFAVPKELL